ncbi:MAG: DNA repair exonuclease [Thermoplasmata archaeon]|jgi:exonuclease SbcD
MARDHFRFAHLADAHIGAWAREPEVRAELRVTVLRALEVVEERGCDFLLISGDLFHVPVPDPAEAEPFARALKQLSDRGCRIYAIYGSHDYVAHRTSWLDVLAASGAFIKVAPEEVRAEGERWILPYVTDGPTGVRIAGVSGRSHGYDRSHFRDMDATEFLSGEAFRIFQFHAAIDDFLPEGLREHLHGIRAEDLPTGCDYYAGGHIHQTYRGTGPGGGLLINPGAVFGTSRTDIEAIVRGRTVAGLSIVEVEGGQLRQEMVPVARADRLHIIEVEADRRTAAEVAREVSAGIAKAQDPAGLYFPRVRGRLGETELASAGLPALVRALGQGPGTVVLDLSELDAPEDSPSLPSSESELESSVFHRLLAEHPPEGMDESGPEVFETLRQLLRELGIPQSEGESRRDYEGARLREAIRLLQLPAEE